MKRPPIKNKIKKSDGPLPMTSHHRMIERQVKNNVQKKIQYQRMLDFRTTMDQDL